MKYGYEIADTAPPYFELLVKRFNINEKLPSFKSSTKPVKSDNRNGIDIFYTAQCPSIRTYIELSNTIIIDSNTPIRIHEIKTREEAQNHICPITTYSVFINGQFFTHEILTPKKLESIITKV